MTRTCLKISPPQPQHTLLTFIFHHCPAFCVEEEADCVFFFVFVGGGKWKMGRWKGGRERHTERVYWLVSLLSSDKFNSGNLLKADAPPDQLPPTIYLSLSSFILQWCSTQHVCEIRCHICKLLIDMSGVSLWPGCSNFHNCFGCSF